MNNQWKNGEGKKKVLGFLSCWKMYSHMGRVYSEEGFEEVEGFEREVWETKELIGVLISWTSDDYGS